MKNKLQSTKATFSRHFQCKLFIGWASFFLSFWYRKWHGTVKNHPVSPYHARHMSQKMWKNSLEGCLPTVLLGPSIIRLESNPDEWLSRTKKHSATDYKATHRIFFCLFPQNDDESVCSLWDKRFYNPSHPFPPDPGPVRFLRSSLLMNFPPPSPPPPSILPTINSIFCGTGSREKAAISSYDTPPHVTLPTLWSSANCVNLILGCKALETALRYICTT